MSGFKSVGIHRHENAIDGAPLGRVAGNAIAVSEGSEFCWNRPAVPKVDGSVRVQTLNGDQLAVEQTMRFHRALEQQRVALGDWEFQGCRHLVAGRLLLIAGNGVPSARVA